MSTPIRTVNFSDLKSAAKALRQYLANDLIEEAIDVAKKYPQLIVSLPEGLRALASPVNKTKAQQAALDSDTSLSWVDLHLPSFITQDPDMLEMKRKIRILAPISDPVLIQGETGTGKEIVAKALHGNRLNDRFIALNCAGMPEYLIESELFGHVRGSFTGADRDKKGLFVEANGGTIFLDEIGDLNINVQAKLLRALQERTIRPVGSNVYEPITCRVVAASHRSLKFLVKSGLFRQDLYARLSVFEIYTKPIRDRIVDIPDIIKSLDPEGKFPADKVDWSLVDLDDNYRSMQKIIKRYLVLNEMPELKQDKEE